MSHVRSSLSALCLAATASCGGTSRLSATPVSTESNAPGFAPKINADDFRTHVQRLSSDTFGGRGPGSPGETLTAEYLESQFKRLRLQPGNAGSYRQSVPVLETTTDEAALKVTLTSAKKSHQPDYGRDMVIGTRSGQATVKLTDSELVFVGYGVNAPEAKWNDYAGVDVRGKTVVILVNDPGFHVGDESLFAGRKMTYYGRWTYKYEEAARQGASAALVIHDTEGAGYGWEVVKNSWTGPQFDLPASEDPGPRLPAQGWISSELASQLFADAGLDFEAQRKAANRHGFRAQPLKAHMALNLPSRTRETSSSNLVAMLPGTTRPQEAVIYAAHWDHLGTGDGEGDQIYNGAIDNATGVAGVLEIAEAFAAQQPPPERSVIFLLVTLEESGLLGSAYYAAHPSVPLVHTVAVVNLDAMSVVGPTKDFVVIGLGNSEIDDIARPLAAAQGRTLVEESSPEKGYFFRSDHFNFAKKGVPALYAKGGIDHIEKGQGFGQSVLDDYLKVRYHKPTDHYDPSWDLSGVLQDLEILYGVGQLLAQSQVWPNYVEGNAFRAARDASRK